MSYPEPTRRHNAYPASDPAPTNWEWDRSGTPVEPEPAPAPKVIRDPGRLAAGVVAAAAVAALLSWIVAWVVAWFAHLDTGKPITSPPVLLPVLLAVLLTAVGAGILILLALYAPRAGLFFGLLTGMFAAIIVVGPLLVADAFTLARVVQAIGNGVLLAAVAGLLMAVAAPTVDLHTSDNRRA